jgi:hypothetical protein
MKKIKVMKTYPNILRQVKQSTLIAIMVLITLFGLTLNAKAQSTSIGNDIEKINNAMVVQLASYDFDIVIPKVRNDDLKMIQDAKFNQMVYVEGVESGYYVYMGAKWEKQNVREVFELVDMNMAIQLPKTESLIIIADELDPQSLLDYNEHVKHLYQGFVFDKSDNSMAIYLEK